MRSRSIPSVFASALLVLVAACARRSAIEGSFGPGPGQTGFHSEGKTLFLGVDLRAARLTGPGEFLPVYAVIGNKDKAALGVDRESFTLETPSGVMLPLATPEEFRRDYTRSRPDERMAQPFLDAVGGKFPEPPHRWIDLELFPTKDSPAVPRTSTVDLRYAEVARGYLYFRSPDRSPFRTGTYKLLLRPQGSDATYVVDFKPYDAP